MRLVLAALLLVAPSAAQAQGPEALAQQRFELGLTARGEERHEEALEAFRESNELFASPNSRLMIARSLRDMGRIAEAWGEYRLAAARAEDRVSREPRFSATIEAATEEGTALLAAVGRLRISMLSEPADAEVEIAGRVYPGAALGDAVAVDPGEVRVRARAPGFLDAETSLTIAAGEEREVQLELEPAPLPPDGPGPAASDPPWEPLGFTFGGFTVLGAILWPVFFALAQDRYDSAVAACGMLVVCPPGVQTSIDEGRTFEVATNVSWISTIGFATLSVTFFLLAFL